jgi:phosphoserine phosphatase
MIGGSRQGVRVAAFFDIDGTLVAGPSLEHRFFAALRRDRAIPASNYLRCLAHAIRLAPRGLNAIVHTNKMYLRGVATRLGSIATVVCADFNGVERWGGPRRARLHSCPRLPGINPALAAGGFDGDFSDRLVDGHIDGAARASFPSFFPAALVQVAWHASLGHTIVLVSGTLAPLAQQLALALTLRLAARRAFARVGAFATRLEEIDGLWTGRILGEAMFGEAKALAVRRLAREEGFDLSRSYAYGNSSDDRWMLGAVGRPAAVNPSAELERIARLHAWPVLRWGSGDAARARPAIPQHRN